MSTHRKVSTAIAAGLAFLVTALPVAAKPTNKPPKVKPATARATSVKPSAAHGPKVKTHGPAAATTAKPALATPKGQAKKTNTAKTTTTTGSRPAPTTTTVPLSKAQQKILDHPQLKAKLAARLPPTVSMSEAASGFKNFGQFMATANAANRLGVDFFALKTLMMAPQSMSLGQAIQQVKGVDPTTARVTANAAQTEADQDIAMASGKTPKAKRKGEH